jgi:hypothetical protein
MGLPLKVEGIQLPEKRLSMRKIKEVLRLRHELGLHQEQIARSCSIGQSTVHRYLERAEAAQLVWPLAEDWDDAKIEQLLFPVKVGFKAAASAPIDFAGIHQELVSHKYLTLQLLWEEYKQSNPEGYQYSWFCQRYRDWLKTRDLVLRQDHRAGEKLFVDHAGGTIPVIGRGTGEMEPAYVFVAVMGASSYTYVEASMHRDLPSWIGAHIRAFEFFQGCPLAVVPDNLEDGGESRLPLHAGCERHLSGNGRSLRRGGCSCASEKTTGQSQSGGRRSSSRALAGGRAAQAPVL